MFRGGESDAEVQLKRRIASQDQAITNAGREYAALTQELKEEKASKREIEHKLNVESDKNVKSQAALHTKTEEYKMMSYLKVNLETSLLNAEKDLKKAHVEVKRLEHQFDVATNKVITLTTENVRLTQLAASRPAPRASISTADRPTSNRFGFQPTPATSTEAPSTTSTTNRPRPSSALGSYSNSNIPASTTSGIKGRRSSISSSSIPTLKPVSITPVDTAKIHSLEREVSEVRSRNEVLEKEVVGLKTKLSNKERELLTMENKVMAMEKEKTVIKEELGNKLEDAIDEVKQGNRELEKVKEKMRLEMVSLTNLMSSDKKSFEDKISRMKIEVEKKEALVEKSDLLREEVETKLSALTDEIKGVKGEDGKALEELRAEKINTELALENVTQLLKIESGKALSMQELLEKLQEELEAARSQPGEELLKLQGERDELTAALGTAEMALVAATVISEEASKAQLQEIDSLKSHLELFQSTINGEEVNLLKSSLDELRSQIAKKDTEISELNASNLSDLTTATETIDALEVEKAQVSELLSQAQADLETLPAALALSQESLILVQAEKEEMVVVLAGLETIIADLTSSLVGFEETRRVLDDLRITQEGSTQLVKAQSEEIQSLGLELDASVAQVEKLSLKIQELENLPVRSFDDLQVTALQVSLSSSIAQAILAQENITSLTEQIESLQSANIEANGQHVIAQTDITALEVVVSELQVKLKASMELANEEFLRAQSESENRVKEVEEVHSKTIEIEGHLASSTLALEDLRVRYTDLEKRFEYSQSTLIRLETVEVDLVSTSMQLEAVNSARDEASTNHLVERGALHARVVEQEEQLQQLNQSVREIGVSLDAAEQRAIKVEAELQQAQEDTEHFRATSEMTIRTVETRARTLETELISEKENRLVGVEGQVQMVKEELSATQAAYSATSQDLLATSARAEASEADVIRLATELELAITRLTNTESILLDLRQELSHHQQRQSIASPTLSPPLSLTSDENDVSRQIVLVTRLREERDELWSRLKFSRTEAEFRFQGLQERLISLEEQKGTELQDLESRLASAVEARVLSSEVSREALEKAKEDIEELKLELEMAESGLKDAEAKLINFEKVSNEASSLAIEFDQLLAKVARLEVNLLAATSDTENLRIQLSTATTTSEELKSTLIEVESELKLVTNVGQEQTDSNLEMSTLRATISRLENEKVELHEKVLRRTQQIALNEQTIGLLRTNQLVAEELEDDDDDTAEILPTNLKSDLENDSASLSSQLGVESSLRQEVESQLATITAELLTAREDLLEAESVAQQSHEAHQASNILIQSNLEIAQTAFDNLQQEHTTTSSTLATLEITYAESHQQYLADRAVLTTALQNKSADVAKALAKITILENSTLELSQNQGMNDQLVLEHEAIAKRLNSELGESITNLEVATGQLKLSQAQVEQLGSDLERMEVEVIELRAVVAGHDDEIGDLVLELENVTEVEKRQALEIQDLVREVETKSDALLQLQVLRNEVQTQLTLSEQTVHSMNSQLESALLEETTARQAAQEASNSLLLLNEKLISDTITRQELEVEISKLVQINEELNQTHEMEKETLKVEVSRLHEEREKVKRDLVSMKKSLEVAREEVNRLMGQTKLADEEFESLRQDSRALENELEALQTKSSARLTELLERLESLEIQKSEVEIQLGEAKERLSASNETLSLDGRVEELEKQLQDKAAEVEETDEKYIEVLRNQKKNLAQIERLRARCEGLRKLLNRSSLSTTNCFTSTSTERDLTTLKSAGSASETISTTPAVKRKRPVEFDPTPSAPLPPRAVVATRTPSKSNRQEKENNSIFNSENSYPILGSSPVKLSGKKEIRSLKSIDGVVPLKDPAPIPSPERKVLGSIKTTTTLGGESTAKVGALSLKAKLAGLRLKSAGLE